MESIFSADWRDCLVAHYTHVIRTDDKRTERSLRGVMHNVGFSDDDLKQIIITATAHVDDVGADFVPDLSLLEPEPEPPVMVAVPQEFIEAALVEAALEQEEAADAEAGEDEDPPPAPDPNITQLSLF